MPLVTINKVRFVSNVRDWFVWFMWLPCFGGAAREYCGNPSYELRPSTYDLKSELISILISVQARQQPCMPWTRSVNCNSEGRKVAELCIPTRRRYLRQIADLSVSGMALSF
jgi:hypothetical protein